MGRIGVLLINLGTPDAPTPGAVRRYLAEFLSDPRVVEIPQIVWQPILRGAVLTTRPRKSAAAYREVWTQQGSPLAVFTRDAAAGLQAALGPDVLVDWAMRYGNPSIPSRIDAMMAAGCDRILAAALYPQYCAATTASAHDAVFAAIGAMRAQPALRTLPPYYNDPAYIEALRASTQAGLDALDFAPDLLLASFHGMPERTRTLGDPYHDQAQETARLLAKAMDREVRVTFQSRFGSAKWLTPATDSVLEDLPAQGVKKVAVLTPGFAADCLETLEEIAMRGKEQFIAAGGQKFYHFPCLNASPEAMLLYARLIGRALSGWR
ncbi:ferrochelatase [Sphingobium sp. AN641]|uniref:ferrochelatase n=1 Tax=Sphingobium sp. AN641 TaxID=3133443 RepID=UPI0030C26FA9